jgi:DNA-directed RNA polymerase subunit RPC12/RpoP
MEELYKCPNCGWEDIYYNAIEYNIDDVRCPKCDTKVKKSQGVGIAYNKDKVVHSEYWV